MKTLAWTGLVLLFVLACCALGAVAMLGMPVTTGGSFIITIALAASAITLVATRPRAAVVPAPFRRTP
jgi:hypothetical protein